MCSHNVVLAILRMRHNRVHYRQDVSVFATATLSSFAPGATVRAALTAVLTDAYRNGGPLAVSFGNDADAPVPGPLRRWAADRRLPIPDRNGWDGRTGEALFIECANLTPGARDLLPLDGVSTPAVCYAVASGAWTAEAVEALLRWSAEPQRILTGATPVTDRLTWIVDRQTVRAALLVETIARVLRHPSGGSEDDDSGLAVALTFEGPSGGACDPSTDAVLFSSRGRTLWLPWRSLAGAPAASRDSIRVRVLAVENDQLPEQLPALLAIAADGDLVVLPADANVDSGRWTGAQAAAVAATRGITVLVAPDYTSTLDATGEQAILRSRTART